MYIKIKYEIFQDYYERKMLVTMTTMNFDIQLTIKMLLYLIYIYVIVLRYIYFLYYFIVALRVLTKAARALFKSIL